MKSAYFALTLAICVPPIAVAQSSPSETTLVHVSIAFSLTVPAPLAQAAPLFGPEGERPWSGGNWDPHFLFPTPAKDVEGAVFTVQHGEHRSVWVNTRFDLEAGRMQYVYFLPDLFVCSIDVALHVADATHTKVDVTYARTALRPEANEHMRAQGREDSEQGKDWEMRSLRILPARRTATQRSIGTVGTGWLLRGMHGL